MSSFSWGAAGIVVVIVLIGVLLTWAMMSMHA